MSSLTIKLASALGGAISAYLFSKYTDFKINNATQNTDNNLFENSSDSTSETAKNTDLDYNTNSISNTDSYYPNNSYENEEINNYNSSEIEYSIPHSESESSNSIEISALDENNNSEFNTGICKSGTNERFIAEPATNKTSNPPHNLKRGDRFTCPDTGLELQVRAVGGRPRKS